MKRTVVILLFFIVYIHLGYAQTSIFSIPEYPDNYASKKSMRQDLPVEIDNSTLSFFPPIYNQQHNVCNQVSVAYYLMSYELNCKLDRDGSLPENQMSVYFPYNFNNGGYGWYGSNFLQSFDLAKRQGIPSRAIFGDTAHMDTITWMSGIDKYKSALQNRAKTYYGIDLSTETGITKLKAWLYDHLNGELNGGVALIMGGYNILGNLSEASPYTEEKILYQWGEVATHARVIVGYNDSIRFDVNGDGEFTNDIDLNSDGIIDIRDSEFGAFKYAESYGTETGNNGYYWAMYRTFAEIPTNGGVLNKSAYVMIPHIDYEPQLSAEIQLNHDKRNQLQIGIGLSSGENLNEIEQQFYFPIVNYQGGPRPMQGFDVSGAENFNYALDLTEILTHVNPSETFRLHLLLNTADIANPGNGNINTFSIVDNTADEAIYYHNTSEISIIDYPEHPMYIDLSLDFDKMELVTDSINYGNPGDFFQQQLECIGGTEPYTWSLIYDWNLESEELTFNLNTSAEKISPDESFEGEIPVQLPFDFPFGNTTTNHIQVSARGYIMPSTEIVMGSYFRDYLRPMLLNNPVIAVLPRDNAFINPDKNDGIWMESSTEAVHIYWKLSENNQADNNAAEYAVSLYPNGNIEFHYGNINLSGTAEKIYGVSLGDHISYRLININRYPAEHSLLRFSPQLNPEVTLNNSGQLEGQITSPETMHLKIKIEDTKGQILICDLLQKDSSSIDLNASESEVFPNPCSNQFRFISNNNQSYELRIFDLQGKAVLQTTIQNNQYVNVQSIQKSQYIVRIKSSEGEIKTFPLIII
ncbi:MAG: T9SS type A sorting domain-containing protein [Bacteroidota bacterium]|nr:T9SS type A sorting domain-containing protein [Bacteroidota bacterium]